MRTLGLGLVLFLVAVGCGQSPEPEVPVRAQPAPEPEPERPKGVLYRDEVVQTVDAGLGLFLQRVEVEPSLSAGRFRGFRIVALHPPEFWHGIDLVPGDVIQSVNGMPIERETEAFAAFESLRTAPKLRVQYQRGGSERELVFEIRDRSSEGPKKPSPDPKQKG